MTRAIFYGLNITAWPAVKVRLFIWNSLWCCLYRCMTHTAETTAAGESLQISSSSRCIINWMMPVYLVAEDKLSEGSTGGRNKQKTQPFSTFYMWPFLCFHVGGIHKKVLELFCKQNKKLEIKSTHCDFQTESNILEDMESTQTGSIIELVTFGGSEGW